MTDLFVQAVLRWAAFSITIVVSPKEFNALTTKAWRDKHGSAYAACFQHAIATIGQVLYTATNEGATVNIYLEDGHANAGGAEEVIREYKMFTDDDPEILTVRNNAMPLKIGTFERRSKLASAPLWAADLLSYCLQRATLKDDKWAEDILLTFNETILNAAVIINKSEIQSMIDICAAMEEEKRVWQQETHTVVKYLNAFGVRAEKHGQGVRFDFSQMSQAQVNSFISETKPEAKQKGSPKIMGDPPAATTTK